jgi:hypothetical protein
MNIPVGIVISATKTMEPPVATRQQDLSSADAFNPTIIEDMMFIDAWEGGQAQSLSAYFRARQIRRANPVRTAKGE